ncbi:hypothetical protein [Maricaulis maris]|uniref:Uncharacterized protein n=1 Tax=Maricaulis maris TaxID=74318 RepID=A0A495D391_9PROT|nr:hypothetical protein [Maricaulis maris]RKQ95229.1 hypothetical protein C7435_2918 [Maricaulis maris]
MLFLFNDVVFDLGDLKSVLRSGKIPLSTAQIETLTAAQLNSLVREAVFADPHIAHNKPEHVRHLVALISFVAPGANALLAVRPDDATGFQEVGLRYANVSITTLASLWRDQTNGDLTAHQINDQVWLAA